MGTQVASPLTILHSISAMHIRLQTTAFVSEAKNMRNTRTRISFAARLVVEHCAVISAHAAHSRAIGWRVWVRHANTWAVKGTVVGIAVVARVVDAGLASGAWNISKTAALLASLALFSCHSTRHTAQTTNEPSTPKHARTTKSAIAVRNFSIVLAA